ncbi:MAG: sensor histidine kinase [bacterium]
MAGSHDSDLKCWEHRSCKRYDCPSYGRFEQVCWLSACDLCFTPSQAPIEGIVTNCAACPVFLQQKARSVGRRKADTTMTLTLERTLDGTSNLISEIQNLREEIRIKSRQVTLLSEVGKALQSTISLDDLLWIVLTAVTAGDGLGFNRAFLLLADVEEMRITGRMGIGPADPAEAEMIWRAMEVEGKSLEEILRSRKRSQSPAIARLTKELLFPFDGNDNIIAASLLEGRSFVASKGSDQRAECVAAKLRNYDFVVVPLISEGRKLGAVLADNFVTHKMITKEDVHLLESFASQAALAIINASLHQSLRERLAQIEAAHEELSRNHWQLMRAERLVALAGLAATLVHDLKTPIVSMGLMVRSALSKINEQDHSHGILVKVLTEVEKLEKYLRDLIGTVGHAKGERCLVDMGEVVKNALGLVKGELVVHRIDTSVKLRHGSSMVWGEFVELRQMVLNLIQNSIEAMPQGGKLVITTETSENQIRLILSDTGVGMDDGIKEKIFSAFFSTKSENSGLGLFLVKRVVMDHGGWVSFDSEKGKGTTFTITLPVAKV